MMNQSNRVAFRSKLTAVSSRPVNPGTRHSFTGIDKAMALHSVHVVFYYKKQLFTDFDLDPFRVCLSEALSLYPPVTGRIVRREVDGEWEVKCNDAGVRVVKATVATTLDEWLESADGAEEMLLTTWDDMPQGDDPSLWSPFKIQINEFEGGGVAIGVSCSHMQADPTCATLFIKSWAETHRREAVVHPPCFEESDSLLTRGLNTHSKNTKSSRAYYEAKSMAAQTPLVLKKMGTATFKFSDKAMKQSLLEIHQSCPVATPFDLLAALFWARIARLKHSESESKHSLSICVDFRKKLQLSYGHYGNALHFSLLSLPDVGVKEDLGDVAGAVHSHVSNQGEGEFWSAIDWFQSRKKEGGESGAPFRMYGPELTCMSMEHMIEFPGSTGNTPLMHTAVFDKEIRPVHVSYHVGNVEGEGLIMVMPSPEKGLARMVTVTLPEEELEQLCEDEAILNLNPTTILSGTRRA
ncbi:protein ECERIFERUM 26-like [Argentina anserina]|uniref:protein ECERIFERUM 26-like n=1 Tax=Argentina anserina TaxID=57926 RepID=UPI0021768ECE|nr:protein ECERIFERUM 26-like [Potentilla anserina]